MQVVSGSSAADWYKDAVVYELHVKSFCDGNGDGIGDFAGLVSRLDYLRDLGVDTIWLLPFYPSPFKDDGYDVADFLDVHPAYGSVAEVGPLVDAAHARGLRVITELVLNHTSDQHPWFQAARRAPRGAPAREFYVWSDDPGRYAGTRIIFTDTEKSNWSWDETAGQYYWHRFFSHQPDLNYDNPAVREAVFGVMDFWLERGVDGFRLDAVPYLIEREGTSNENLRETHEVIKELRRRLDAKHPNRLLLAEANMWPEDVREYFGDGDECHMAYHFPLMPRMYMAIAQEDRHPVVEILAQTPEIPPAAQWAIFLRNHDELTLEMVTHKERDYMVRMYAADPRARLNLGIRRRLAPLLEGDRARIELMNSLLLSMPGSPVLYYGDEIGMGDNIFLGDRDGVRTPMQWSAGRNAGFSDAEPERLVLPVIRDAVYGYEAVNVDRQSRNPSSLLEWTRRMLALRRSTKVFGRGRLTMLHPGNRKVLAYLREHEDEVVLCVANVSRSAQPVEIELARHAGRVPVEMLGGVAFPPLGRQPYPLTLPPYGFLWLRLSADARAPDWYAERRPVEDLPVLVLFDGWNSLFRDRVVPWRIGLAVKTMAQFEGDLLPRLVARERGAGVRAAAPAVLRVADHALLARDGREWLLALVDAGRERLGRLAAFALAWEEGDEDRLRALAPAALAKVRHQARVGVLADALADEPFCRAVVAAIGAAAELPATHGRIVFRPTAAFAEIAGAGFEGGPRRLPQARDHALLLGERLFLKVRRRLREGPDIELEVGRFLSEKAGFAHHAPVAGSVEWQGDDGGRRLLMLLQAAIPNQGDAWTFAVEQLARELDRPAAAGFEPDGAWLARVRTLGQRSASLHAAFATRGGDPAFEPEPVTAAARQRWMARARVAVAEALALLARRAPRLAEAAHAKARALDGFSLDALAARCAAADPGPLETRIHGGYQLQELLVVHDDFAIVDFDGDPGSEGAERRHKQSPLRDVASLLHSIAAAGRCALQRGGSADPGRDERRAQAWVEATRRGFLQAYGEAAVTLGLLADEAGFAATGPWIELFEFELAFRELRAGLRSRAPDGALAALADLVGAPD